MDQVRKYYSHVGEREWFRLDTPSGALELEVNSRIIEGHLPAHSRVLDIGGGPGRYALWLAELGHEVVLADLSPRLLEIARERIAGSSVGSRIRDVVVADARDLSRWDDDEFDAALCLGPFYHLPDAEDRERAALELRRVVRAAGLVFAAFMPWQAFLRRTASIPEERRRLLDPVWLRDLIDHGRFENDVPDRFNVGHGARPAEIMPFFERMGFTTLGLFASEGLGSGIEDVLAELQVHDPEAYGALMAVILEAARDPSLFGLTTHLLYVGRCGGSAHQDG